MIPAFINDAAGTAEAATRALKQAGGFDIHAIKPDALENAVRDAASHGAQRIVVAGGDGTIGTAARALCGTQIALAVVPGGTLNHFARDHGIPTDADEAAAVAAGGVDASADVAFVGDHLFLNTSSVGAYVVYVRLRDRMEKYVGYRLASLIAAVRLFLSMRPVALELEVDGKQRQYSTPVVFIGVGERETRAPTLGSRVEGGRHCLHVIVVRERRAARLLVVALDAAIGGLKKLARTPEVDSFMVDSCSIQMQGRAHHVSVDGEIIRAETTLRYRLQKDALHIIVPDKSA